MAVNQFFKLNKNLQTLNCFVLVVQLPVRANRLIVTHVDTDKNKRIQMKKAMT